jgi:two-component system chemotaxis sensor kinase CheA
MGISLLLIVCTGFNLGYSYKLFIDDKTSYIFEAGLKKAENISDQINFKLSELVVRSEFNLLLINNSSIDFEKMVNNQNDVVIMGTIENKNTVNIIKKQFSNTKNINRLANNFGIKLEDFTQEVLGNLNEKGEISKKKLGIFSPKANLKFLLNLSKIPGSNNIFFSVSDLTPLLEIFFKDETYTNKIVSLADIRDRKENAEWISKLDYNKSKKGAFKTRVKDQDVLVSYAFVNDQILVLNAIDKSAAFGITKFLILKTTLFALFLIGIATIFGIFFSSSITFPIVKLTDIAKRIAGGDFSSEVQIKTSDEIKVLGDTFNFMSTEIRALLKNKEDLIAKLEDYSKNLEKMVAQRTLELKEANDFMALMVNSLDQGLLVFDSELKCNPLFTKACEPIFGISPLNKTLPEVLGVTTAEGKIELTEWANVTFSEMIPFESAAGLAPQQKITGTNYNDPDYKFVQMNYYPMKNEEDKLYNIVMVVTDKTSEVQATERAKEREAYVSMILKILNNKIQFSSFLNEVNSIMEQFKNSYSIDKRTIEFDLAMILFHTMNGGFGIYSVNKLQELARDCESEITKMKDNGRDVLENISELDNLIETFGKEYSHFKTELDNLLGTKFSTNENISEIPREKIYALRKLVQETRNQNLITFYQDNFIKVPIITYFKAYDDLCRVAAQKTGKPFKGLDFHNENLMIEAEPLLEFFNVLVHLFRNCIDHGLENNSTRKKHNKSPEGHIDISFKELNHAFSVVIKDDGAGIDPQIIRTRYKKLNPDLDISKLSDTEVIYKIFDPFFSTRDEVSALSGRGVGMSAIKEVVDRMHGKIYIESIVGSGTTFSFEIPVK